MKSKLKIIKKPWGSEQIIEKNKEYMLKKLYMKKGHKCSLQYHNKKVETIYVLSGKVNLFYKTNEKSKNIKKVLLKKRDLAVCKELEPHALQAVSDCEIMVFTKGPRQGKEYENDTFRLVNPLV